MANPATYLKQPPRISGIEFRHLEHALDLLATHVAPALMIIRVAEDDAQLTSETANRKIIRVLAEFSALCQNGARLTSMEQSRRIERMDRDLRVAVMRSPADCLQALIG